MTVRRDRWAEWLAVRRFGGDPEVRRRNLADLIVIRDKVLDLAELTEGESVLDVGCGEGMIAFGALERGAGDDASVDLVTTRSVLIYVARKREAFREFARVLKPGGRISLFEPINRFALRDADTFWGYDVSAVREEGAKLRAVFEALQPRDSDPMVDFDERDLLRLAEEAGFFPIRLLLEADIKPSEPRPWDAFLNTSGNPNIPTMAEAMEQALTPVERDRLTAHLRPQVERGLGEWRMACAYLVGRRLVAAPVAS